MSEREFRAQMARLESEFGAKSFGVERLELIKRYVFNLPVLNFSRIVDHLISTSRYAPLPKDFKEAAIAERRALEGNPRSIPAFLQPNFVGDGGLQRVLKRDYPGCKTLAEAIEVERLKVRRELKAAAFGSV